jgi:hypothetical protein
VKTKLLLDSIDSWLLVQPSLINKRKKALLPVVRERTQIADALARYLAQLGLDRRAAPPIDLGTYVAALNTTQKPPEKDVRENAQDSSTTTPDGNQTPHDSSGAQG